MSQRRIFIFKTIRQNHNENIIHRIRVVNALACNARGDRFEHHLRRYFRDLFLESIVSGKEELKMLCVASQELTVTCCVSGDNW